MTAIEAGDRVRVVCPSCSPEEPIVHEVLSPGGHATVRCTDCHQIHKSRIASAEEIELSVIVSNDGESSSSRLSADADETIEVGDEFIVDTEAAIHQVRVTGIEVGPETRVDSATMDEVETVWTRVVDNVTVNVTLHPKDGNRDQSRSISVQVPGDYEFAVGSTEEFGEEEFTIEGIHVRQEVADDYRFEKFDRHGDTVFAKDVKRLYGRDESSIAWSPW